MCDPADIRNLTYVTPLFDNPIEVVPKMAATYYGEVIARWPQDGVSACFEAVYAQMLEYFLFTMQDVKHVLYIAVGLTILRFFIDTTLFKQIPKWVKMEANAARKFPESAFSFTMYTIAWLWALYIVLTDPRGLFTNLSAHWIEWHQHMEVDSDVYWLYMLEMGLYVHFLFTTLFINTKRKDFAVLVLHHFLTFALLGWAYGVRFHYVGLMVLFLHDIGDVTLEFAKMQVYFKEMGGKKYPFFKLTGDVAFGTFTIQWVLCRLYWFPMKAGQSAGYVSMLLCPGGAFYVPFNSMLIALYLMQLYWFYFIVKLLIKVLLYGEEADDNREFDVAEKRKQEGKKIR